MYTTLNKASRLAFTSGLWIIFGLMLWGMDFSVDSVIRYGQQIADRACLNGAEELVQSGILP